MPSQRGAASVRGVCCGVGACVDGRTSSGSPSSRWVRGCVGYWGIGVCIESIDGSIGSWVGGIDGKGEVGAGWAGWVDGRCGGMGAASIESIDRRSYDRSPVPIIPHHPTQHRLTLPCTHSQSDRPHYDQLAEPWRATTRAWTAPRARSSGRMVRTMTGRGGCWVGVDGLSIGRWRGECVRGWVNDTTDTFRTKLTV